MYVYRCTLYTTLQHPGWKRKARYSQSLVSAHFLRACGHYLCMIRGGHPYRPAYLPNFDKRSLTISKCMFIGAHCIPHCKILLGKERPATLNQTVMHICCNSSWKKKEQGVAHAAHGGCCPAKQIYAINTSSSKVLPRLRKRGVAPPEDICEYIHLHRIYT